MTLGELIRRNREQKSITVEQLADKLGVAPVVIECLEQPEKTTEAAIAYFANIFNVTPEAFKAKPVTGQKKTEEKISAVAAQTAVPAASAVRYPAIRAFLLSKEICADPEKAAKLFGNEPFPIAERNVVLYMSTTALYNFCDKATSSFSFEEYLFRHHRALLDKFEKELDRQNLPYFEREERVTMARGDVFRCEKIENIAILVLEDFATELEKKLSTGVKDFQHDCDLPFKWEMDDSLMRISIRAPSGGLLHEIKLLDVKERG
jgi:transcriptional regulator with XRE-family HTH domain